MPNRIRLAGCGDRGTFQLLHNFSHREMEGDAGCFPSRSCTTPKLSAQEIESGMGSGKRSITSPGDSPFQVFARALSPLIPLISPTEVSRDASIPYRSPTFDQDTRNDVHMTVGYAGCGGVGCSLREGGTCNTDRLSGRLQIPLGPSFRALITVSTDDIFMEVEEASSNRAPTHSRPFVALENTW